ASAFSRALPTPAFGPTATGSAGLRAWNRPAPAGPLRGFRAGSGGSAGRGSGTASLFGGGLSGVGNRVALQFLVFGGKVPVELRPSPFRQGRLPFPVSGSRPIRDSAAFARRPRRGFKARG